MNGDAKHSSLNNDLTTATSSALLEQLVYIDNFMNNLSAGTDNVTPNMDIDGQLSVDLAAFADDSFIFPDEDKKHDGNNDDEDHHFNPLPFGNDVFVSPKQHMDMMEATNEDERNNNNNNNNDFIISNSIINPIGGADDTHNINSNNNNASTTEFNNEAPKLSLDYLIPDLNKLPKFPVPPGAKSSLVQVGLTTNQIELLSALIAQHQSTISKQPQTQLQLQLQLQLQVLLQQQQQIQLQVQQQIQQQVQLQHRQQHVRQHNHIPGLDLSLNISNSATPSLMTTDPKGSSVSSYSSNSSAKQPFAILPSLNLKMDSTDVSFNAPEPTRPQLQSSSSSASIATSIGRKHLHTASASLLESLPLSTGQSDLSSEFDKRRRNTAALARFRVKKKLKEKQMENKIHQLTEFIDNLENKILHLETENKVLRTLILEKGEQRNDDELKLLKERATNND